MESFRDDLAQPHRGENKGVIEILRAIPLFQGFTRRELQELESVVHRREFRAGEPIFHQGDPGIGMYVIYEGSVGMYRSKPGGGEERLAVLRKGEVFGESALLDEGPRPATARALEPSVILGLFQPEILELIERKPRLGNKLLLNFARILGERLHRTQAELEALRQKLAESPIVY
ncbi:MAG: cyclic nucleotide-binding domain-containing protein [candidate division KSB1 bacterium]|nr:cyclic nucleotide-binding domain-containing protein [candidate division KSB1 bacterium]